MGLLSKLKSGDLGFTLRDVMDGTHQFEHGCGPTGRLPLELDLTWRCERLGTWIDPFDEGFLRAALEGTITVGGLCTEAPCRGTVVQDYFTERAVTYTLDFEAGERGYTYVGRKVNVWPWTLPASLGTCFGTVKEANSGKLVTTSVSTSRLWRAPWFVGTLRLT